MVTELARAKINLCLHVVGKRGDGLHLLDSIVAFPEIGDVLIAENSDELTLEISGEFSEGLSTGGDNLILKAAKFLNIEGAHLHLQKNLPVASGIGGGSADAAAAVRVLCQIQGIRTPEAADLAELGSDVPACLAQYPARMSGVGENLAPLPKLPTFWMVLANSGDAVDTGAVFKAMNKSDHPKITTIPMMFSDVESFFDFLSSQRNDMEIAALEISPSIGDVLAALGATKACALARMSGSGGTCFGLYATEESADIAAQELQASHPDWWVVATRV